MRDHKNPKSIVGRELCFKVLVFLVQVPIGSSPTREGCRNPDMARLRLGMTNLIPLPLLDSLARLRLASTACPFPLRISSSYQQHSVTGRFLLSSQVAHSFHQCQSPCLRLLACPG